MSVAASVWRHGMVSVVSVDSVEEGKKNTTSYDCVRLFSWPGNTNTSLSGTGEIDMVNELVVCYFCTTVCLCRHKKSIVHWGMRIL